MFDKYDDKYEFWQKFLLEYYEHTTDTIRELSEKLDCTYEQIRYFTKKHNLIRRDRQKYSSINYVFIVYKGDKNIYEGTKRDIIAEFDISEQRFKWMCTKSAEKRNKGNAMYIKRKHPRKEKLKK